MPWDAPVVGGKSWIDFANRDENHSRVAGDAVFAPPAWRRKTRVRTCSSCIQVRILIMVEFWERDAGLKLVPELGGGSLLGVPCEILPWAGSILNNWSLWPIVRFVSRAVICQTWIAGLWPLAGAADLGGGWRGFYGEDVLSLYSSRYDRGVPHSRTPATLSCEIAISSSPKVLPSRSAFELWTPIFRPWH